MGHDQSHMQAIKAISGALYDFSLEELSVLLAQHCSPDLVARFCEPHGTVIGVDTLLSSVIVPLATAWPDLERRDTIIVVGRTPEEADWVGVAGYYTGTFVSPWLDIPPTGHQSSMRFHEFYRFVDGKIVEIQAIWDIPEVMMQAGAWPLVPSLGREWHVPGPATQDGLRVQSDISENAAQSLNHVLDMLTALSRHPAQGGPEVMELDRFWHPKMNWYGPSGIGTARGIDGFRNWHQIPFLSAMPDRGQYKDEVSSHFFATGNYVAVTGWPDMAQTLTGGGWLGLPPTDKKITLRSLDFWRLEDGLIRENWVLLDLIDVYRQLGVDVLGRMREFNKARIGFDKETGEASHA
ncbi:ester cyclase [Maritalea sp.]|uniref:ester cyclase n=1 Tax=Maritalea sp. TaxID=2003361 RepID=UPI003EF48B23